MEKIVLVLAMLLLLGGVKCSRQNWVSPAGIHALWNCFFIFFAVVVFGQGIEWHYAGIYWMLASCALFLAGQCMGRRIVLTKQRKGHQSRDFTSNLAGAALVLLALAGFGVPLRYITGYGYRITDLFHLNKLLEINVVIAQARYSETLISRGTTGNILLVFSYFACLMGGYLFLYTRRTGGRLICFLPIVPVVANMMITNTKATLIAAAFLWASGYLTANVSINGNKDILSAKLIRRLLVLGVCGLVLFDLVMMLRIGEISAQTQRIVAGKLQRYAFGHIHAFSYWFASEDAGGCELGVNTYMFLTNWLGLTERKIGVYEELPELRTNIFTQQRGVIADFGKFGGLLYWLLLGLAAGVLWRRVQKTGNCQCLLSKVLLAALYFSVWYGFIISPWIYSSYVLAFVLFLPALLVIRYVRVQVKGRG